MHDPLKNGSVHPWRDIHVQSYMYLQSLLGLYYFGYFPKLFTYLQNQSVIGYTSFTRHTYSFSW